MLFCEYVYEWVHGSVFVWGHMLVLMDVCIGCFLCGYVAVSVWIGVCVLVFVCNHLAAKDCIVATEWVRMTVR